MNTKVKYILATAAIALSSALMSAQTLNSLYFLEGNNQRNNLNPAFTSDHGYVTFPMLGNMYIGTNSNIGLGAIMQPSANGNEMVTFLHNSISAEDALSRFKDNNIIESNIGFNVITVGFNAWGGSNTIALNVKSNIGLYLPKSVFTFLKVGQNNEPTEYDMTNIRATTQNYAELALGHARDINDKLTVGAKVKLLVGAGYANTNIDKMKVYMSDSKWVIDQSSSFTGSKGINFKTKEENEIDDIKFDNFGIGGLGAGLDLGAVYRINEQATVSLAVTDLGFITWKDCVSASNKNKRFEFDGFDNIGAEDEPDGSNKFDDAADEVWDNLKGLVKYYDDGAKKSETTSLYTTLRAAGEYGILNNKISFGLLGTARVGSPKFWGEGMLSANFRPAKWFNATINGSVSTTTSSVGGAINFHPKAVNFFIGGDYLVAKYSKQLIPVNNATLNMAMGLSFNF